MCICLETVQVLLRSELDAKGFVYAHPGQENPAEEGEGCWGWGRVVGGPP